MDMIDKYLAAVAAQLPADQRDDIIAELKDLILSRFEAKEEEVARALTDEEREAILHEVGHPLVVAARYRKGPDSLVGPELFPYWLFAVKVGVLIIVAIAVLTLVFGFITDPTSLPHRFGQAVQQALHGSAVMVGAVTITAAIMEHYAIRPKWMTEWKVRDLEHFGLADTEKWTAAMGLGGIGGAGAAKTDRSVSRAKAKSWPGSDYAVSFIATGLFALWWIGVLHFPVGVIDLWGVPGEVRPAPIWLQLYWPILGYALACMAVDLASLARPYARRMRAALRIVINIAGLGLVWIIFNASHWFTLVRGDQSAQVEGGHALLRFEDLRALGDNAGADLLVWAENWGWIMGWVLAAISLSLVIEIVTNLWRLSRAD